MGIGFEFQPGGANDMKKKLNQGQATGTGGGNNPSEVLKILSLHLPRVLGGRPLTPLGMDKGPGGGGLEGLLGSLGGTTPGSAGGATDPGGAPFAPPSTEPTTGNYGGPSGNPGAPTFNPGSDPGGMAPIGGTFPGLPTKTDPSYGGVQPPPMPTKGGMPGGDPKVPISKAYMDHPLSVMLEHFFPGGFGK